MSVAYAAARMASVVSTLVDRRHRLLVLLCVAMAARVLTFGNPILHVDEEYYFVFARAWLHGVEPYVGIWDRKPIGLFLIYLPAAALGYPLGIWAYQAMALGAVVVTAWLIGRLADRAGWSRGALAGGIAYIVWADLLEGSGGQAPIFYNVPIALAAMLIAPSPDARPSLGRGFAAMALVGLALQIKYSVVFEGAFFGLWLLCQQAARGRRWSLVWIGAGLAATALAPTLIAWLAFRAAGAGDAWVYANFLSIIARSADPFAEQAGNLAQLLLIVSPLVAAALLGWRYGDGATASLRRWLLVWMAAAAIGLLVFGTWFLHYALPLTVPAAICASGFFSAHARGRRIGLPLLLLVALGGQLIIGMRQAQHGSPHQFSALVDAVGHGPGALYVYSGDTMLYVATGRPPVSRYVFPSHLGRQREKGAVGVDQANEVARILAQRPAMVVLGSHYRGERAEIRAYVVAALRRSYQLRARIPLGSGTTEVFARRSATSPA